jgi:pilus assembly protein FimV
MSSKTLRSPNDSFPRPTVKRVAVKPLRVAVCVAALLAVTPPVALALELGEATLRSALGQPLVVEIPYQLAPSEQLTAGCIGLVGPRAGDALPAYSRVGRIAVTPTHIEIVGATRVLEPLLGLTIDVHCPSVPRFVRSYELFVDPPSRVPAIISDGARLAAAPRAAAAEAAAASAASTAAAARRATGVSPPAPAGATLPASARPRGQSGGAVLQGETYLVVSGDTLSGIAARIVARPVTIREAADAIFAANPDAFTRGDRDLLKAGRSLTIPLLAASTPPSDAGRLPAASAASPPQPAASEALSLAVPPAPAAVPAAIEPPAAAVIEPTPLVSEAVPAALEPAAPAPALAAEAPAPAAVVAEPDTLAAAAAEPASAASAGAASTWWWTALLALGAATTLSAARLVRRRKPAPSAPTKPAARRAAPPRRLVDPLAGFDVVEGRLPPAPAPAPATAAAASRPRPVARPAVGETAAASEAAAVALGVGLTDPVDIDVGSPVTLDERVDWFADRDGTTTISVARAAAGDETTTGRTAEPDAPADANRPRRAERGAAHPDEPTLTLVELEMLRQDYEAERTLTQAANKALRDAVADLEATQTRALRAANGDTATLEIPDADSREAQPTQRLRKAR